MNLKDFVQDLNDNKIDVHAAHATFKDGLELDAGLVVKPYRNDFQVGLAAYSGKRMVGTVFPAQDRDQAWCVWKLQELPAPKVEESPAAADAGGELDVDEDLDAEDLDDGSEDLAPDDVEAPAPRKRAKTTKARTSKKK